MVKLQERDATYLIELPDSVEVETKGKQSKIHLNKFQHIVCHSRQVQDGKFFASRINDMYESINSGKHKWLYKAIPFHDLNVMIAKMGNKKQKPED